MKRYLVLFFLLSLSFQPQAFGTTLIFWLTPQRILVASDTRATFVGGNTEKTSDSDCKLSLLGSVVFAATGLATYSRVNPADPIPDWDAVQDAEKLGVTGFDSVESTADRWALLAQSHYSTFYRVDPARLKQLASSQEGILVTGAFVGWNHNSPELLYRKVYLDTRDVGQPVRILKSSFSSDTKPYSTNSITQEIIRGDSPRASVVTKIWDYEASHKTDQAREEDWLEFLVKATHTYDRNVSAHADIVEMFPNGTNSWMTNYGCKAQ